jgi:hypothetical protein
MVVDDVLFEFYQAGKLVFGKFKLYFHKDKAF